MKTSQLYRLATAALDDYERGQPDSALNFESVLAVLVQLCSRNNRQELSSVLQVIFDRLSDDAIKSVARSFTRVAEKLEAEEGGGS